MEYSLFDSYIVWSDINAFLLLSSDLSSYTPKHSVEFNAWQEHKLDESAHHGEDTSQSTEEVMVRNKNMSTIVV